MHATSRHGTPSLTPLPKDDEVSSGVRPPRSPIRSLTSLDQAQLQSPDEDCISSSAIYVALKFLLPLFSGLNFDFNNT